MRTSMPWGALVVSAMSTLLAQRSRALVGTPSPEVTRQVWAPATWAVDVPRIWRTPSVIRLKPWT